MKNCYASTESNLDEEAPSTTGTSQGAIHQQPARRTTSSLANESLTESKYLTPPKAKKWQSSQDMGISPSDTLDTVDTTESSASSPPIHDSVLTIKHQVNNGGTRNRIANLKRPTKLALGLFFMLTTGGAAFLFSEWLTIPGLTNQIKRLEAQVDRLGEEVGRLSEENDRFEGLNDQLNSSILELVIQNDLLNESNTRYAELNAALNSTVLDLKEQNEILAEQNEVYAELNDALNVTSSALSLEVTQLDSIVENLSFENDALSKTVTVLSREIDFLSTLNSDLNSTVGFLESGIYLLSEENDRLENLTENLGTIVTFLNETSTGVQGTYDALASFLSGQIIANRVLVLESIQNAYLYRTFNWDCTLLKIFALEDFASDINAPIGASSYPDVIDYVEKRILSQLCLDTLDFERYLDYRYLKQGVLPPVSATINNFLIGIQWYTTEALDFYFPDENEEGGLSKADWTEASYDCDNLPDDKRFSFVLEE